MSDAWGRYVHDLRFYLALWAALLILVVGCALGRAVRESRRRARVLAAVEAETAVRVRLPRQRESEETVPIPVPEQRKPSR